VISFERGVSLFDSAAQPKLRLWLGKLNKEQIFIDRENNEADHNGVIFSNDAARAVRIFFDWDRSIL
jgi:hypothetical protein